MAAVRMRRSRGSAVRSASANTARVPSDSVAMIMGHYSASGGVDQSQADNRCAVKSEHLFDPAILHLLDTREMPYVYKGESTLIPAVIGDYCPACGEVVLSAAESGRTSKAMMEFNKQTNASIVDPAFIAAVRKKLALDQQEAAAIFGGGVNAFSRYENGKTKPPLSLVKITSVFWSRFNSFSRAMSLPTSASMRWIMAA